MKWIRISTIALLFGLSGCRTYFTERQYILDELDSERYESNEQWFAIRGMQREIRELKASTQPSVSAIEQYEVKQQ
jgi:hypothetical protein